MYCHLKKRKIWFCFEKKEHTRKYEYSVNNLKSPVPQPDQVKEKKSTEGTIQYYTVIWKGFEYSIRQVLNV